MPAKPNLFLTAATLCVVAVVLAPAPAGAQYLDPGAGSIVVQAVIAVVIGLGATLKIYWHQISGFVDRRARSKRKP